MIENIVADALKSASGDIDIDGKNIKLITRCSIDLASAFQFLSDMKLNYCRNCEMQYNVFVTE